MNSSKLLTKILREEIKPLVATPIFIQHRFEQSLELAQRNLNEAKTEAILRKPRLVEYYTASNITDPNFRPKKPWTDVKAETTLKRLGAKPYRLGINPHGYELDTPNDRLWFYSDGEVYSTNQNRELGYEVAPGGAEIEIWNAPGAKSTKSGFKVGVIKNVNGKPVFTSSDENLERSGKATETPEESSSGWDTFQTILDWAGLVPVIGDALDVINAVIYFIRGKWFDGLLSMIAVIPLVGSGIKLSIKAIYKGAKIEKLVGLLATSLKTKNTEKLWRELMTSGAITKEQLKDLGPGLENLAEVLKSSYSGIRKIPFIDSNWIIKQLDEFAEWMKSSGKTIDDLADASKRAGAKQLYKAADDISSNVGFLRRFGNSITGNVLPKLKRAPFWPAKKIQKIALGLETRFAREMAADPTKLTSLIKLTPNQNALIKNLRSDLVTRTAGLPKATQAEFRKRLQGSGLMIGNTGKINLNTASDWSKFLEITELYPGTRGLYDSAAQQIIKHAKDNDSIMWNLFKTDRLNNIKTILSKDMIPEGSNLFKELDFSFRKNADIIWNELQDVGESLGIKSQDDVNGVVWPAVTYAVAEYLPGVYDAGKTVQGWVKAATGSPAGQAAWNTAKKAVGIDSQSELAYDPEAEKGGDYK